MMVIWTAHKELALKAVKRGPCGPLRVGVVVYQEDPESDYFPAYSYQVPQAQPPFLIWVRTAYLEDKPSGEAPHALENTYLPRDTNPTAEAQAILAAIDLKGLAVQHGLEVGDAA